jgi:hypothetical protein
MSKTVLNAGMELPDMISEFTRDILSKAGDNSENPTIIITSGIRSPQRQASAMYENLSKGIRIRYAAPGQEVTKVYDSNKSKPKNETIRLMIDKIIELSKIGKRVSLHCVSEEEYARINIVDVSKRIPNPRDFVKALIQEYAVTRVITPFYSDYKSNKVSIDAGEPAIHVEVKQ